MVRLGEAGLNGSKLFKNSFNSSMVRLGVAVPLKHPINMHVSIPVWFDWEFQVEYGHAPWNTFQFQYGSIGS